MTSKLPALFVSHGSPMFAIDKGTSGPALTAWAAALTPGGKPRGAVVMSPHWMARAPAVMTNPTPPTWHDFGGFPPELYRLQYPAPGDPALAREVIALLHEAGIEAQEDPERPLDHGAWVPLMHLFPGADVPVVQVALPADAGPREVYAMGRAVRPLRARGVLVMGTGSMTHNLAEFFGGARPSIDAPTLPYVQEFARWVEDAVARGDMEALFDYRRRAPHAQRAHPSEEHFLPIFFALGAADDASRADYLTRETMYGNLAMDSLALGASAPSAHAA